MSRRCSSFLAQTSRSHSKDGESWFVQHSQAATTLAACVQADPQAVWEELSPHLEEAVAAHLFAVGFSPGVLGQLPHGAILDWIRTDPETRANVVAQLTSKRFDDESLGAKLLDRFGSLRGVSDTFLSAFMSGAWTGDPSRHWTQLAEQLEVTAKTSTLPGVRKWAREGAIALRRMATVDRKREAERKVRSP